MKAPFNHVFFGHVGQPKGARVQVRWMPHEGGGVTWIPTYDLKRLMDEGAVEGPVLFDRPDLFFNSRR